MPVYDEPVARRPVGCPEYGGHGCRELCEFHARYRPSGSSCSFISARMRDSGRSRPRDVPPNWPYERPFHPQCADHGAPRLAGIWPKSNGLYDSVMRLNVVLFHEAGMVPAWSAAGGRETVSQTRPAVQNVAGGSDTEGESRRVPEMRLSQKLTCMLGAPGRFASVAGRDPAKGYEWGKPQHSDLHCRRRSKLSAHASPW